MFSLSGPDVEGLTLPEGSEVTEESVEGETSTPDLVSSSVMEAETDSSQVTPSLPQVTEQDRGGAGGGEEAEDELLLDITNTTLETGETSTTLTGISEPDSTTENLNTLTTPTTITTITTITPRPGEKTEAGSDDMKSCENNVCRNGGTCLTSIDGFQCHCRLDYGYH